MTGSVALLLAGLAVVMGADVVGRRTGLPDAVLLVLAGLGYGFLPGPNLDLDPHLILIAVLPPLLYAAALESSLTALRGHARAVVGLSVGLVLVTAVAVGAAVSAAVAAVPLAAAVALGAAVAPPDPVAALAIGRRAGLPPRLTVLIEGEGLLNDATALTILQVAVAVAVGGHFSVGHAVGEFVLVAAGGLVVGLMVGVVVARVRLLVADALVDNALSLGTPFAAYLLAEELHTSGVLAVVVAGLWLGHHAPSVQSSEGRLQTTAVWRLVNFLLEGYVFLLIGQQLPTVVRGLDEYSAGTVAGAAVLTSAVVLLVRPAWFGLTAGLHGRLGGGRAADRLSGPEVLALSWAGTRGVITLAAIFSVPASFPARDLLAFCAYVLVLVTLVGQGLTFGPLIRRLHLGSAAVAQALVRNQARIAAVRAGLGRLDQLVEAEPELSEYADPLRRVMDVRLSRYEKRVEVLTSTEEDALPADRRRDAAVRVRREMITAEREELVRWRDAGRLPDAGLRTLQRELDYEESLLPASRSASSGH